VAVVALVFLWYIRDILVIVVLSLILASTMDPLVNYLRKKHIPRLVSVLAVYLVVRVMLYLFSF